MEITSDDIRQEQEMVRQELSFLFGEEIVGQADLIDVVDLKLNDEMTQCISNGITQLKKLKGSPLLQKDFVGKMPPGEQLVLCMWIMEMGLLYKLQSNSYIQG